MELTCPQRPHAHFILLVIQSTDNIPISQPCRSLDGFVDENREDLPSHRRFQLSSPRYTRCRVIREHGRASGFAGSDRLTTPVRYEGTVYYVVRCMGICGQCVRRRNTSTVALACKRS